MSRERPLLLLGAALLIASATIGCNASSSGQRARSPAPERVAALGAPAEPASIDLSFSLSSSSPEEEEDTDLIFGAEGRTLIAVDRDTVDDASGVLHFTAARRGQDTIGVRVFFEVGEEDGDRA